MSDFVLKDRGLKALLKAFSNPPHVRLGVLGEKGARTEAKGPTNAEVGAAHEFGTSRLPIRSFLRMPITQKMGSELEQSGAFDDATVKEVIRAGSIAAWLKKVGIVGEKIVQEAFATGGFGQWKPSNMKRKKNHQTLVETQQLRNSITSEVKE